MTFAIEIPYLLDKVWLFPAIMAGSFLIILFFGKRLSERVTSSIGILAVTVCFIMSLFVAGQWIARVNHRGLSAVRIMNQPQIIVAEGGDRDDFQHYQTPVFGIDAQGSAGASAPPF